MMAGLRSYQFPVRGDAGLLLGLSATRLAAIGMCGVVFVVVMAMQTAIVLTLGSAIIILLLAATFVRLGGRPAIEWVPVWLSFGWAAATRNTEFYRSPELALPLPDAALDLPGELFGLELHEFAPGAGLSIANPTPATYGVVRDVFRSRLVAICEVSGADFLFLDPDDAQARISGWGATLDHLAQSLPELCRLQVVHTVADGTLAPRTHEPTAAGGHDQTSPADSYAQVAARAAAASQEHRLLVAVALETRAARRAIRQAGGGLIGAGTVLMDRAASVEETLRTAGLAVHGWLPARAIAALLRSGFDPGDRSNLQARGDDVTTGGGVDPAVCGPTGVREQWSVLRHDRGWSTTLQVVGPPSRPVTGDFLQHLLIGVAAERRVSWLFVPTGTSQAERRAQSAQVSAEAEQAVRARWGFASSARQRRQAGDAARREAELVEGRTVYRVVWLVTVTATELAGLDVAVGHIEAAARRCGLELSRLAGTQRQAAGFTLPLCRGAR